MEANTPVPDERSRRAQSLLLDRLKNRKQAGGEERSGIPRRQGDGPAPLSFAQERLWFLDRLEPGSNAYNVSGNLRLHGPLDLGVLTASLDGLVARHEALRTVFAAGEDGPVQVVAPALRVLLPPVDLQALPDRVAEARRLGREEFGRPFDLAAGPLLRATLLRLEPEEHILLLTLHHIVTDGWSMRIFLRELTGLYDALSQGRPSPLPELPIQYADFAAWQRAWLSGEVLSSQLAWWRERMADAPAALELPVDHPRAPLQSRRAGHVSFRLSEEVSERLPALARERGATVFMVLLAAFQILLQRHTGQEDIVVGTPIANRNRVELEGLIGFFANSLALRSDLSGDPVFAELLGRVRETALGAFGHQDLPFEKLVAELRPERDLTRAPVFQVMFVLQNVRSAGALLQAGGLRVESFGMLLDTAKFDLTLSLSEGERWISGQIDYNGDLIEPATALRLAGHFQRLLGGIAALAAIDEQRISALPLLSEGERQQVLAEWGDRFAVADQDAAGLHQRFERQVDLSPEAPALTFEGRTLTYGELERRANRLARYLLRLGVEPGARVGLCLERSLDMVVAILAVLKAGGAYVPLDPAHPAERLAFTLEDSGVAVVLAEERLLDRLPAGRTGQTVRLDTHADRIAGESAERTGIEVPAEALAYVIYTSGSTGRPKGVGVTHTNVVRLFQATDPWFRFGPDDVWTLFHSYAFDFSVWEIWGALLHGGRLVVVPYWVARSPEAFWDLLCRERVTVLNQTPSAFRQLVSLNGPGEIALRSVIFGGEALDLRSLAPWFERWGDERPRLVNMYGITETTVHVTWRPLSREDLDGGSVIGRAIPDLAVRLLDARFEPVPIGVAGEIFVGGAGVAPGYLGRPELTAQRFVPDPFAAESASESGARLYRSGDLARYRPNGDLEYLGRIDHQVKIRGFRIEIGEIEAAIAQAPGVRHTLVLAREDTAGERSLVAYVVPEGPVEDFDVPALRERLRRALPEYMVPSAFVAIPSFPLTANGKIDRRALPQPDRPVSGAGANPPRTELERAIAEVWCGVLKLPEVGLRDNFFDLGGHSLLLVRLQRELRDRLGLNLALVDLFQRPTVASLADLLAEGERTEPAPAVLAAPAPVRARRAGGRHRGDGRPLPGRAQRRGALAEALRRRGADLVLLGRGADRGWSRSFGPGRPALCQGAGGGRRHRPVRARLLRLLAPRGARSWTRSSGCFLECAWEALEDAAIDPERFPGRIGVFAGASENLYVRHVRSHPELVRSVGYLAVALGNRNDYLPTRVSYKLDLRGPSLNVQTACSTSLVAVHLACRSLLLGECEAALAGGVSLIPGKRGYYFEEGGIASPDGHTRAFSAHARGTVAGDGAGVVVLKRLADAVADGDRIYAVIRGTAINNDGSAQGRLHRAQRRRPGGGHRRRPCRGGGRARDDRLCRGARHGHPARRSHRDRGADPGFPRRHAAHRLLRHRLAQDEHRAPRRRGRGGRPDQDGPGARPPPASRPACTSTSRTRTSTSRPALPRPDRARGVAGGGGAAARGRQLLRHRRHERARRAGGGAAHGAGRPFPVLADPAALRPHPCGARRRDPEPVRAPGAPPRDGPGRRRLDPAGGPPGLEPPPRPGLPRPRRGPGRPGGARREAVLAGRRRDAAAGLLPVPRAGLAARGHGGGALRRGAGLPRAPGPLRGAARAGDGTRPARGDVPGRRRHRRGRDPRPHDPGPARSVRGGVCARAPLDGLGSPAGGDARP